MTALTQPRREPGHRDPGPAELVQLARIARRYYLEGKPKRAIAEEFGLSRFQVARSLLKARESGLVRITMDFPCDTPLNEEEQQ